MPQTPFGLHAEYVAEAVRQLIYAQYGDATYARGLKVYTSISADDQSAAYKALRDGIMGYERSQTYRGPEGFVALPDDPKARADAIDDALAAHPDYGDLIAAVVLAASAKEVMAVRANGETLHVIGDGLRPVAVGIGGQGSAQHHDPSWGDSPPCEDAERLVGNCPATRGRGSIRGNGSA